MSMQYVRKLGLHFGLAAALAGVGHVAVMASGSRTVRIQDRCDPETFDAAVGPGTCVGDGKTTFDDFIAELTENQSVGHWRFHSDEFTIKKGEAVNATNEGGEVHSFTPVSEFGAGGLVPILDQLSGQTTVADGCANPAVLGPSFLGPGQTSAPNTTLSPGLHKFQCCIHPWMRTEITVRKK
jgi:plastocyanin